MNTDIWIYIETENGKALNVGYELINAARPIAAQKNSKIVALVVGKNILKAAEDAIGYGAEHAEYHEKYR